MRSKRVMEQLGMSHGAAAGQLRKRILFHLLTRLKENVCFKCNKEISIVDELSIEHKLPWENVSANLFWDLDNIAFSHLRCNTTHVRHGGIHLRKISPDGMSWCNGHKKFMPRDLFYKNNTRWRGVQDVCKECNDIRRGRKIQPTSSNG